MAGAEDSSPAPADAAVRAAVLPVGGLAVEDGPGGSMRELRRRRRQLAQRVAELTWDLGGLAYEMAIRDHYRLDVIARKAAELQQADAELDELQRLLAGAEAGIHGQCRSCGAVHSRGAAFCWHCGASLREEARPAALEPGP
jgi:transposase